MSMSNGRSLGGTEYSWCKAVLGGTGIATLGILIASDLSPAFIARLNNALRTLQNSHPILKSRLKYCPATKSFSFVTCPKPYLDVKHYDSTSTSSLLESLDRASKISDFHILFEHEMNTNSWPDADHEDKDVVFASLYELPCSRKLLIFRLHVAACDRTTAFSLLTELRSRIAEDGTKETKTETLSPAIEDLVPAGIARKSLWGRGVDMIGYSVNSFRLTNLAFKDTKLPRRTQVVKLQLSNDQTQKLIAGCSERGIKLAGALAGAGLIAAYRSKNCSLGKQRKYGVVTFTDCRSVLPPLTRHHFGFYHSAVMNSHVVKREDKLWDVAEKYYKVFVNSKKSNRHFTDMADLNFLMCKAIENPTLTSSSSLRTSLMAVFEDTVIDDADVANREVGVEDYMGCASVHGIGPTVGLFDTIRDGCLNCICVYPSPLHSRDQMAEFISDMKTILEQC